VSDRHTRRWLDVAVATNFLAIGMMFVAVPRYVIEELDGTKFVTGLATTIFFLTAIVTRPLVGRAMDRRGRRPFMIGPLAAMAVTTVAMGFTTAIWMIVVLRLIQGGTGSSFYTAVAAAATDLSEPERRGAALARLSVMVYLGFAIGPTLGEVLFDRAHWMPFLVAAGLHVVSMTASVVMREPLVQPGAAVHDEVSVSAMRRAVLRPGAAQFTVGFAYACLISFLSSYSREIGLGSSGALFLTFAVCTLVVRAVSGPLGDRIGYAAVAVPGIALIAAGQAWLAGAWAPWVAFPAIAVVGIGFGASFPALTAIAAQRAPDAARGAALGAFLSFNDLGNALAGPLVGLIADAAGFRWAYGAPAIVAATGAVVALSLRGRDGTPRVARA
jgi:MFS family permease